MQVYYSRVFTRSSMVGLSIRKKVTRQSLPYNEKMDRSHATHHADILPMHSSTEVHINTSKKFLSDGNWLPLCNGHATRTYGKQSLQHNMTTAAYRTIQERISVQAIGGISAANLGRPLTFVNLCIGGTLSHHRKFLPDHCPCHTRACSAITSSPT